MKIAVITDLHTISPNDRFTRMHEYRRAFADAWPSFKKLNQLLHQESPDLVINLGDMVDWYSDENRDFALELLEELPCTWLTVPGNHDFESNEDKPDGLFSISAGQGRAAATKGWLKRGIELHNRYVDAGNAGLILLDSATSEVAEGTREWLKEISGRHENQLLFTHVPIDLPETRQYILSKDPNRNLNKYVQSKSPWVFHEGLQGKVGHVFSGHLHFPGELRVNGTIMHMLGMSITDLNNPGQPASACIIELHKSINIRRISIF